MAGRYKRARDLSRSRVIINKKKSKMMNRIVGLSLVVAANMAKADQTMDLYDIVARNVSYEFEMQRDGVS